MRKLALATAAAAALMFSAPAFTAPAFAQADVKVKIKSGDRGHHRGWGEHRSKKVVIHRDRGRHEGWRHRDSGMTKKVIIKRGGGEGGSRTVIKKKTYD